MTSIRVEERPSGYRDGGENFVVFISDEQLGNTVLLADTFDAAMDKVKGWYNDV